MGKTIDSFCLFVFRIISDTFHYCVNNDNSEKNGTDCKGKCRKMQCCHGKITFEKRLDCVIKTGTGNKRQYCGREKHRNGCFKTPCQKLRCERRKQGGEKICHKVLQIEIKTEKINTVAKCGGNGNYGKTVFPETEHEGKAHRADNRGKYGYNITYHVNTPVATIANQKPKAIARAVSKASQKRKKPAIVSPFIISLIAFVSMRPGMRSIISPIIILSR